MENKVYWYNCEKYDEKLITEAYQEILVDNGLLDFVTSGMKIGIKVNLVGNFGPDKAATTHPLLVKKLCELLIERGAIVTIGDSPGGLFTESILKSIYKGTGFLICEEVGAKLNYDVSTSQLKVEKQVVKTLDVSNWLLEQDALINFAKLKSHGMMALSASVKNMFGIVPGVLKPEYHYRYPNHDDFANMLIDINEVFDCKLNLIDGIIGMEGNGPTQGEPRYIGAILASRKPYPLDVVACKIIDLDIDNVYTVSESIKRGLTANYDEIILNKPIDDIIIKDYKNILPGKSMEFSEKFKGPFGKIINPIIAKVLTVKPKVKKKECIGCKKCANICPVNAIEMIKKKPVINRDKCIRCFCCQEFCPVGAMKAHKNIIVKILTK
ncbi:MAG: DUF362 domain-containing protein [Bacilli bacterium]|jgi:uncharacterized protein (DUF362 family)/Pyruvate/2-oxoacid:ferredoxin oxidoreductase delta subunit|nr:DUF362 domain-containing protein [Bacilli bacterium]